MAAVAGNAVVINNGNGISTLLPPASSISVFNAGGRASPTSKSSSNESSNVVPFLNLGGGGKLRRVEMRTVALTLAVNFALELLLLL